MNKRPLSVTVAGSVMAAAGLIGLVYHVTELDLRRPLQIELIWVLLLRITAIVCGIYIFRGKDWARWLTLIWLTYHVILSGFHAVSELVMHSVLLALFAYILFSPLAAQYFRGGRARAV